MFAQDFGDMLSAAEAGKKMGRDDLSITILDESGKVFLGARLSDCRPGMEI
jgi:hypothetical protein